MGDVTVYEIPIDFLQAECDKRLVKAKVERPYIMVVNEKTRRWDGCGTRTYNRDSIIEIAKEYDPGLDLDFVPVTTGTAWDVAVGLYKAGKLSGFKLVTAAAQKETAKNNDGRATCYACGASTKSVMGFNSEYQICTKCGK
jgi:hypothetical protein